MITDPPDVAGIMVVHLMTGALFRCLCTFSGRKLALAPVSSLNIISVETVESHDDSDMPV